MGMSPSHLASSPGQNRCASLVLFRVKDHPGSNAHCHQLLEQQLAGIWHEHLNDVGVVLVDLAAELLLLQVGHCHQAALLAHVHAVGVTLVKQALLEECSSAVTDDAIALHLSEAQTTIACTTLHWLAGQDLQGTAASAVDLEVHHMLQALVVCGVEEDLGQELTACGRQ